MGLLSYVFNRPAMPPRPAVARILRTLGEYAFDLPEEPAPEFAAAADELARRVASTDIEHAPADTTEVVRFVSDRRRAEAAYVREIVPSLRDALFDVVRGVMGSVGDSDRDDAEMSEALDALANAVETGRGEDLAQQARAAIGTVRRNLERRRQRESARLESMGRQLKTMQARVAEAEFRETQDKLTGLPNRAALDARLDREVMVAQLTGAPLCVLMLDVDHFKRFNDTWGHAAGDEVLRVVGKVVVKSFPRKSDFGARYGGEEFCIVLSDVDHKRAVALADRFRQALEVERIEYEDQMLSVTCSVGVAQHRERETVAEVLGRADKNLYAAKRNGRNQVQGEPEPGDSLVSAAS